MIADVWVWIHRIDMNELDRMIDADIYWQEHERDAPYEQLELIEEE